MEAQPISNEVALRIGLAAHSLPETSVGDLIEALEVCLGSPLTEASLSKITVTHLKSSLKGMYNLDGEEDGSEDPDSADIAYFKEAVRILWGQSDEENLPHPEECPPGAMPNSIRVAVASNEGELLNGHFGSCLRFLVYQVSKDEIRLVDVRSALPADLTDDKNGTRVKIIDDCAVVYVVSLGGPAMAKVIKADIHISQHPDGGPARDELAKLQPVLAGAPPPWMKKRMAAAE